MIHFVWKQPDTSIEAAFANSQTVIEEIKQSLPVYHSRAMRSELIQKFGCISPSVKPAVLRYFYKDLAGSSSCSETTDETEIDERVKEAIEMEDTDIVMDLKTVEF